MKKYKNFLFDLDGTLYKASSWMLYKNAYFADEADCAYKLYNVDKKKMYELLDYIQDYVIPNVKKPNFSKQQVVYTYLADQLGLTFEQIACIFEKSASENLNKIKDGYVISLNKVVEACKYLKKKGYKILLATNSYFTRKRVLERLSWIGVSSDMFEFVNDWSQTDSVKPDVKFFDDLMQRFNMKKNETLMVGNDKKQDAGCLNAGIDFYLITEEVENSENNVKATYEGGEEEFYNFITKNF